ncbi:MAG: disulfide bond formation protein B [Erythrobacter sp.]|nr:disulfide bond formation protein B [Erythrobacter sp.]MBA4082386.1 disulfide bond formation protein B [Erythrobacter sp.]MBA4767107.1 disulfide bond formation protein B [Porphyrobacter sp.]
MDNLGKARALAVLVPAALLGGAYVSQYGFGLFPCEMCWWQRYPHFVAVALGLAGFVVKPAARPLVMLAGLAIIASGLIGLFHAGVEYGWWEGITKCTATGPASAALDFSSHIVACDIPQWTLWGVSLAGFNFLFSSLGGAAVVALAAYRR